MIRHKAAEKRQHPRIDKKLPFNVAVNGYDFKTTTQNISCLGAYCHIDKYIPPFTKVAVKMNLAIMGNRSKGKCRSYNINCNGVIVRTEDDKKSGFNIAIFFNELKHEPQQKISRYINQFLPKKS